MNLLASLRCNEEVHLIVGSATQATWLRLKTSLLCGATPTLVLDAPLQLLPLAVQDQISSQEVRWVQKPYSSNLLTSLGRKDVDYVVDRVFVTVDGTLSALRTNISTDCRRLRVPVNVSDSPDLCTFTLLSTHTDGPFQLGVTTSGKGCKLANRIRRELAAALPPNIGAVCDHIGALRLEIQACDGSVGDNDDDAVNGSAFNRLVHEFDMSGAEVVAQRAKFLSQIVEYYPLSKLGEVSIETLSAEYKMRYHGESARLGGTPFKNGNPLKQHRGAISLVGAGPGAVSMLTLGALQEILSADLVLADKLVPQQVLDLIPQKRTRLFIARKFPGNAEKAQQELLSLGLEALQNGEKVVRLKQGDPYIFGRGGEEHLYFTEHGYAPKVLPGITSALAAPVYSNIPATHREVADQVLICTGTGRRGALPNLPDFVPSRTTVFLMALHRIVELIPHLILDKNWAADLPVAIVERASCPDQRVIRTTLAKAPEAVEALGSRPPGLFIAGYACSVLSPTPASKEGWVVEEGHKNPEISGVLEKLTTIEV